MAQLLAGSLIGGLHVLNEVDALVRFGLSINFTLATLNSALAAIGGDSATLLLRPGTWTVTDNLTIPANVALKLPKGCLLTVTTLKTLTINGTVQAGPYQVFGGSGTTTVNTFPKDQAWWGSTQRTDVIGLLVNGTTILLNGASLIGGATMTIKSTAADGSASQIYLQNADGQNLAIAWHSTADSPSETPNTHGRFSSGKVYNAVYNDVADFLELEHELEIVYGKVYIMEDREVKLASKYCQKGILGIASNTFGFGVGAKEKAIPISVAGYVLAYVDKVYSSGTPLTSTKDGYLTKMNRFSCINYPDRLVATFLKEELKNEWHGIKTLRRHWVKVK